MTRLQEIIEKNFKGDVASDSATLENFSRDASLFHIRPELVVSPRDVSDVKNLVQTINEARQAGEQCYLTARSAGTDMTGGPLGTSVVVDFLKYFNHIKNIQNGLATTEPGVYYRDFDAETKKQGMILPSYPASRDLCTVGGMTANNSGGEKNLNYGKTENYVHELKIVLRDGNEYTLKALSMPELEEKLKLTTLEGGIYRNIYKLISDNYDKIKAAKPDVSKNSAGYYLWNIFDKEKGVFDLTKLIVGSQGTLGLITEVTFKLVKPKTHSKLLVVFLNNMKNLGEVTNHLLQFHPESLESYDDHTFKLAAKLFPQMVKKLKGNIIGLGLRFLPEFWAVITGGIPKLVILAEFTAETDEEAHNQAVKAQESLREFGLKTKLAETKGDVGKYWTIRRESFNMLRHHVKNLRTAPFIDDFVVRPEFLPEFLPKLYGILDQYSITYTVAGHVGDGNFHIIPLMDFHNPESVKIVDELMHKVFDLVISYHGSITGEHNDGIVRTPFLSHMYSKEIIDLFEKTKKIFDPENIFNPGKKVGGTWEYAMSHLDLPTQTASPAK